MLDFKQRTVMITGAAGNLGRAVASAFRMQGANLVLLDINAGALDEAYPGDDEHFFKCEVNLMDQSASGYGAGDGIRADRTLPSSPGLRHDR